MPGGTERAPSLIRTSRWQFVTQPGMSCAIGRNKAEAYLRSPAGGEDKPRIVPKPTSHGQRLIIRNQCSGLQGSGGQSEHRDYIDRSGAHTRSPEPSCCPAPRLPVHDRTVASPLSLGWHLTGPPPRITAVPLQERQL